MKKIIKRYLSNYPGILKGIRNIRDSRGLNKEPVDTILGFKLLGNKAMQEGLFEPIETNILSKIIPRFDLFINVGANIGYYCCLAASKNVNVLAFEPIHLNLQYLLKNIEVNNFNNFVEVFPVALSDHVGIVKMYGDNTGASLIKGWASSNNTYTNLVPSNTLDYLASSRAIEKFVLILIDIEGSEFQALKGATALLSMTPKPVWIVEICIREHQPEGIKTNPNLLQTFDLFWDLGYQAFTLGNKIRLVSRSEILEIINGGSDLLNTHNFIFCSNNFILEI